MTDTMKTKIENIILTRLNRLGVSMDVTFDTLLTMLCWYDLNDMNHEERCELCAYAAKRMDEDAENGNWRGIFEEVSEYLDDEYYNDNLIAFLEYKERMGQPDFDWDFYSDWHKDMYGYRPR